MIIEKKAYNLLNATLLINLLIQDLGTSDPLTHYFMIYNVHQPMDKKN